jgi:hypothetical protein
MATTATVYRSPTDEEAGEHLMALREHPDGAKKLPVVGTFSFPELPAVGDSISICVSSYAGGFDFDAGDREYKVLERIYDVGRDGKARVALLVDSGE